ncbi:MAG: TPM domain-containing protein [Candidatus Omnitrophica bacterium]|nr:TPM domain-containing protein [Candidatus Omnitrophota bacterium]
MKKKRSHIPSLFLSKEEKKMIIDAIGEAEKNTSGEIRVHLEAKSSGDVLQHAKKVFEKLKMTHTAARNGTLIFLCVRDKKFAIIGDRGIHDKVPENFWRDVSSLMQEYFKKDLFAEGLAEGIKMVGEKLKVYFPYQKDDVNELPDDISF